jgi:hypothetical protein
MGQPTFQGGVDGICNLAAQGPLQFAAAFGFAQAFLAWTEVGRAAHPRLEGEASVLQADHP